MKRLIFAFIVLNFYLYSSCNSKQNKKEFDFYEVSFENHTVKIYLKENRPFCQKYFEKNQEVNYIDSIVSDSMYSYQENKLVAKGKWKEAENKKLIHTGWTKLFFGDSIYLVDYIDYDTLNDINIINREKLFIDSKLDSSESYYYKIIPKQETIILKLKTLYKPQTYRYSYLIMSQQEKHLDSIKVYEGKNIMPRSFFNPQSEYFIRTYYLKNGKRINWSDMKIVEPI